LIIWSGICFERGDPR